VEKKKEKQDIKGEQEGRPRTGKGRKDGGKLGRESGKIPTGKKRRGIIPTVTKQQMIVCSAGKRKKSETS